MLTNIINIIKIGEYMSKKVTFDINKLYIITDFDHTLTTKDSQNCWSVLSEIPNIDKDYIIKSKNNHKFYFQIEQNDSIEYKIKNKLMKRWYENHIDLLIKYNFKKTDFDQLCYNELFTLRNGVKDFLQFAYKKQIPIIIVSAGITDIIEKVLKSYNCFYNNIYIIANIFKFHHNQLKSLRNDIIHSVNKNQIDIPAKITKILNQKDEVILIGDNLSDLFIEFKNNKKCFKIGCLNYQNKLNMFQKYCNLILQKDDSFLKIVKFIK